MAIMECGVRVSLLETAEELKILQYQNQGQMNHFHLQHTNISRAISISSHAVSSGLPYTTRPVLSSFTHRVLFKRDKIDIKK